MTRPNYLTMNLTQPPFDDLAVRRAMNWVMDRGALRKAWGGASAGPLRTTSCPDSLLERDPQELHPFKTPSDAGGVVKARPR